MLLLQPDVTCNRHSDKRTSLMKPLMLILLGSLVVLTCMQCKPRDHVEQASLYGKWDIVKAERNGKETPYLRGGYLIINADGAITVNITGEDEKGRFELDKDKIKMNDQKEFIIRALSQDSMTVAYTASPESDFIFYLNRHEGDTQ